MTPDEAVAELTKRHGWSPETLNVWWRARFKCEYCDAELLRDSDAYFRGSHLDHIVPHAGDGFENLALACAACNYIKRGTDPSEGRELSSSSRTDLIGAAKAIINGRRTQARERLAAAKPYLQVLIDRTRAD